MQVATSRTFSYSDKTGLYQQLEQHPWVYLIQEGFVVIDAITVNGKHGITDLYGPGSWFGPGLADGTALQNATAQQGSVLERFSVSGFARQLELDATLALRIVQQLAVREQHLQQRLFVQQTAALPARLLQILRYLFNHQGQPCQHGHDRDVRLSQQDLADMVGGSRQSVSQLLVTWKREGAIDYARDYICLEDMDKLQSLVEE